MRCRKMTHRYALQHQRDERAPRMPRREERLYVSQPSWRPSCDIFENDTIIHITVEIAGLKPDEMEIILYEDALIVEGKRCLLPFDNEGTFYFAEILQGPFKLEIYLPARVDPEHVQGRYEQGLLFITLNKKQEGGSNGG